MQRDLTALKSLHTALIDARNGYDDALKDAEGKGLTPLFREMSSLHGKSAAQISEILTAAGEKPDDKGSFMTTVHKTVISLRSLVGELDEHILPGLIDGEKRLLQDYDAAIADPNCAEARDTLLTQRRIVAKKIDDMQLRKNMAA